MFADEMAGMRCVKRRREDSSNPVYLYGRDYEPVAIAATSEYSFERGTAAWATGHLQLASLDEAITAHRLLFDVLRWGGAEPPYWFT
jgi:hypothetical protein